MSEHKETSPTSEEHIHDDHDHDHGPVDFEPEGINAFMIMGVVFATSLVVVVLVILGFAITGSYSQQNQEEMLANTIYPEIRDVRAEAIEELKKSGVVDADAGIYRISIDEAMDLMVNNQYQNPEGNFTGELKLTP